MRRRRRPALIGKIHFGRGILIIPIACRDRIFLRVRRVGDWVTIAARKNSRRCGIDNVRVWRRLRLGLRIAGSSGFCAVKVGRVAARVDIVVGVHSSSQCGSALCCHAHAGGCCVRISREEPERENST